MQPSHLLSLLQNHESPHCCFLIMKCPKCSNKETVKAGEVKGRQRYKCKKCNYHFTVEVRKQRLSPQLKRKALFLFLEGVSTRRIEKLVGVNHTTLLKWIAEFGLKFSLMASESKINLIDLGSKKLTIKSEDNTDWTLVINEKGSTLYTREKKKSSDQRKYSSGTSADTLPPKPKPRKTPQKR